MRYLIPRQLKESGLTAQQVVLSDEALNHVIGRYTREAGVRQLERAIGRIARVALRFAEGDTDAGRSSGCEDLPDLARAPNASRLNWRANSLPAGVATGLAWTEPAAKCSTSRRRYCPPAAA